METGRGGAKAKIPEEKDGVAETKWRIKGISEFSDSSKEDINCYSTTGCLMSASKWTSALEPRRLSTWVKNSKIRACESAEANQRFN